MGGGRGCEGVINPVPSELVFLFQLKSFVVYFVSCRTMQQTIVDASRRGNTWLESSRDKTKARIYCTGEGGGEGGREPA